MHNLYSSYIQNNYGQVFDGIGFTVQPKLAVDIGLLEGWSSFHLKPFAKELILCDSFGNPQWKHADMEDIKSKFPGVEVKQMNYYAEWDLFKDDSIDLLHIDVGNHGDTYRVFLEHYFRKLSLKGVALLEGGSEARDNWWWMSAYGKPKIQPVLGEFAEAGIDYTVLEAFPSMTIVRR